MHSLFEEVGESPKGWRARRPSKYLRRC